MTDNTVSKTSELRIVIQEPNVTYAKLRSSNHAPIATSTSSTDMDAINMTKHEDVVEEFPVKSTDLLVKNLKRMSHVKMKLQREEIEEKVKKKVTLPEEKISGNVPLRGEQLIKEKRRGSISQIQSNVFKILPVHQTFNEVKLKDSLKGEEHYSMVNTERSAAHLAADSSTARDLSVDRTHYSTNIVVQNMIIDVPPKEPLPLLVAVSFESVLQECLDCMQILQYVIPAVVDERHDYDFKSVDEKYGVPDEPRVNFREDMGLPPLVLAVAEKMQKDRKYVYDTLKATLSELKHCGTYDQMETDINNIVKIQESEHNLQVDCEIWTDQVKQLRELIESSRIKNDLEKKRYSEMIQKTNALIDDSIFLNASKLGYIEKWENAKVEQQIMKLELKENELTDALSESAKIESAEEIVLEEVQTYLQTNTKNMEDEIMIWTSQYNEEIERREQEINELKEQIENESVSLRDLYALRDERQVFIDECLAEKDRFAKDEVYWQKIHRFATIIQALWRGVMVRRQLGQFKNLWVLLRKRKKLAVIAKKKKEVSEMKKAKRRGTKS